MSLRVTTLPTQRKNYENKSSTVANVNIATTKETTALGRKEVGVR